MSPSSAGRAEKLGYTNVRVYHDGLPEWTRKNFTALTAKALKEAFLDKDMPVVLIDLRQAAGLQKGFIKGAVSLPAAEVAGNIGRFPPREMKPPIVLVDQSGGQDARDAARRLIEAGYTSVSVMTGGMDAWAAAQFPLQTGSPATAIAYVPKPRPGELGIEEFRKIAAAIPADTVILDVRTRDEAGKGMIKGAVSVPEEELLDRLAELPKDKRIVTHCSTGVRAEMAYYKLKEKGYNARFVNAKVDIDQAGNVTVEKI